MRRTTWIARVCGWTTMVVCGMSASADVFTDCTAWYIGGKGTVGAFANGDMTDIRHAAIADSPTHGGATRANAVGISNLCENVYSAASGRTFENQRTIYLAQRDGMFSGTYKVYENGVTLPFAATNENYTLLLRMKLDDTQPTNKEWVYIADFGYNGGTPKHSFGFRYSRLTEQIGVLYNGGSNSKSLYVTNDVCPTLRGKWLEFSVSLEMLSSGKSRMRFGVGADGLARTYGSIDYQFPDGQNLPYNQKLYLGGTTGYGNASPKCSAARGSYHMISYWERVLSDDEIREAFALQGPDGSAECSPAVLKVGDSAWGADVFGGANVQATSTPSLDLQNLANVPMRLPAGGTLSFPFEVPLTVDALRQVLQLAASAGTGELAIAIDGTDIADASIAPGKVSRAAIKGEALSTGSHVLTLRRTDGGSEDVVLSAVELSGSWRLGWKDGKQDELGGDITYTAGTKTTFVANLMTNNWTKTRSGVSSTRQSSIQFDLASDLLDRKFTLRTKPEGFPGQKYDCVIEANGNEVFRRTFSPNAPYDSERAKLISVTFQPGDLSAGRNEFIFKTVINEALDPSPNSTWLTFDYFELEAGNDPSGIMLKL